MKLLVICIIFLSSCSLFKPPKSHYIKLGSNPKTDIKKYVAPNCLSSDGVGKLNFGQKSYQFQYESVNNEKDHLWSIGLYFAMLGEEVLRLKYDYQKISGSLYKRIETLFLESEEKEETKAILENVKASLSVGLRLITDIKKDEYQSRCSIVKKNMKRNYLKFVCFDRFTGFEKKVYGELIADNVIIRIPFDDSFEVEILFDDWHGEQWKMTKISLRKKSWWSDFEVFSLLLRAKTCSV